MATTSEAQLDAALDFLARQIQSQLEVPDAEAEFGAALLSLLRAMVVQAEGVRALSKEALGDAAYANVRAMFEAWIQIRYLCASERPVHDAVKYRAFAILELLDMAEDLGSSSEDLASATEELNVLRARCPEAIAEVEALRSGKLNGSRYYWSGLGPTAMVRRVRETLKSGSELLRQYKFLSWDAHQVMTSALDSRVVEENGIVRMQFGPRQSPDEASAFVCGVAQSLLADAWNALAARFHWPVPS